MRSEATKSVEMDRIRVFLYLAQTARRFRSTVSDRCLYAALNNQIFAFPLFTR